MVALNEMGSGTMVNAETGGVLTKEGAINEITYLTEELPKGNAVINQTQAESLKYYKLRNRFFLFGFVGVFLAKIASPYIN